MGRIKVRELGRRVVGRQSRQAGIDDAREEITLRRHVLPGIGEDRVERIRPGDVERLVNEWRGSLCPRTVKRNYEALRAMFGYAVRNEWLARSPCRNIVLPSVDGTRCYELTPETSSASPQPCRSGMRDSVAGATLGLRWSEVAARGSGWLDLEGGRPSVSEALVRGTGAALLRPPSRRPNAPCSCRRSSRRREATSSGSG